MASPQFLFVRPEFCRRLSSDSPRANCSHCCKKDTLGLGCILPTTGRIRDFHPLERAPTGRTQKEREESGILPLFEVDSLELEINFIVRQQSEGRAGLSFAVVDAEAEHNYSREQVQKMTLRLKRAETDSYDFSPPSWENGALPNEE